jgi:hypothetical protein
MGIDSHAGRRGLTMVNGLRDRLPLAAQWLAGAAVVLLAAWLAAGWIWELAAPGPYAPPATPPSDPIKAAEGVAARHWFSAGATGNGEPGVRYKLYGAMTGGGGRPGIAIIGEDGRSPMPLVEGEEFAPGLRLERVLPRAVELRRQGVSERLELPENPTAGGKT